MLCYLFVDMNAFFASVEQQEDASLRGRPIGVVPVHADTTCCIAASYEAKAFGVRTGTGVRQARELCPEITFVLADPRRYVTYHHAIVAAVETCLHVDQVCSIDEMFGRLMRNERDPAIATAIAQRIKRAIAKSVGESMQCSIGIAPNAWLAKVGSDMQKPDGLTILDEPRLPEALFSLKLDDLPGIGRRMLRRLNLRGIVTVEQLCRQSEKQLAEHWESTVMGAIWHAQLRGQDLPHRPTHRRTVGHSHVLAPQWRSDDKCKAVLVRMIHKAAARMRRLGYTARHLMIRVSFLGGQPAWVEKVSLGLARDTLTAVQALDQVWHRKPTGLPLKAAVTFYDLEPDRCVALPMFEDQVRRNRLADAMDRINSRQGRDAIYFAGMFGAAGAAPTRISFTQIPQAQDFEVPPEG